KAHPRSPGWATLFTTWTSDSARRTLLRAVRPRRTRRRCCTQPLARNPPPTVPRDEHLNRAITSCHIRPRNTMTLTTEQPPFTRFTPRSNLAHLAHDAVRLVSLDGLNFAMAHNSVPLVRELALTNPTSEPWTKLTVSVHLQGFAEPWTGNVEVLEAGATYHFEDLPLRYDAAALL